MNKKLVSLLLTAVLSLGVLTGCSSKEEPKEADTNTEKVTAEAVDTKTVFVTPEWVQSVIDGNQKESENYVIGEVSWGTYKDSPSYTKGHIPGAIHINTDSVEEGPVWNILSPEKIEKSMLENGITKDTTVILYGDPSAAGRVAFTYLWAGVENVKMLNGGIEAWEKAGYKTETDVVEAKKAEDFGTKVPAHPEYCLSIEDTKEKLKDENFKLVSIRSEDEFLGKTSGYAYINKAGEPEGAVWGFDTDRYVNEDGTCINMEQMKELWNECDFSADNELSFYCGTGWRACVPWLICYENGMTNMTVFDGGWNEWQMDDSNPVQVGDPASDDCVHTTVGELSNDKAAK
ncbi:MULTISPECIES: sulfurtransferase [Peptostreptococcales]|uniref:sulfurtransferase n=1 Tax=Peptostreptococcales TaxID=3082720 RepID=UPI000E531C10|nr:rhodanese-like domain-containing protein [Peptoclostridium sp. AF21-18]RHQ99337.1 sulfurtransferase [Peptoclostridium sp. AF21-18]